MGKKLISIEKSYFSENRRRFFEELEDQTIVVLFSGTSHRMTADQDYPFRGNNNFFYLTGIEQEGSVLIIKKQDGKILKLTLFIRTYDAYAERWYGYRLTRDDASKISGIYDVSYSEGLEGTLKNLFTNWNGSISIDKDAISGSDIWFSDFIEEQFADIEAKNVFAIFSKLRRIKSGYEIDLIKKAIEATKEGILRVIRTSRAGMAEYELAAEYGYAIAKMGLGEPSFESIIATGKNFNCLHYVQLDSIVKAGDMILMDVGAFYGRLSSDISRAFPIDGKFTKNQRIIYQIVRDCQEKAFEMIRPGVFIKDINLACKNLAGEKLIDLGIFQKLEDVDRYYWHNVSHHLGLDVHDICGRDVMLESGMVITVEPGVYIPEWNVGLRIEDDVLVTSTGCEVLSDCIPREADEIEALMTQKSLGLTE